MQALDPPTLLLVNAVFNGIAAAGWALLAGVFRMAPRASWLMVGAHLCRIATIGGGLAVRGWPLWASDAYFSLSALATTCLLALAVRRMLRLGPRWRDVGLLGGLSALGTLGLAMAGQRTGMLACASVGMGLMGLLAARDVLDGAGPGLARWVLGLLALPYMLLALIGVGRATLLLMGVSADAVLEQERYAGVLMSCVWLVLAMAISVSLMAPAGLAPGGAASST